MGKARTKAQKIKAKRGRPLLPAADRAPNGRRSQRVASLIGRQQQSEREVREVVAAARARHLNITKEQALDPRRGYALGNLLLDGKLTQRQHDAGVKIGEEFARYYGLKGFSFPSARAQDLFAVRSNPGEDSKRRGDMAIAAAKEVHKLRGILLGVSDINTGRRIYSACMSVCVEDIEQARNWPEHMILLLRKGLNKVGDHYGMPA